jgi:hypothetical protein
MVNDYDPLTHAAHATNIGHSGVNRAVWGTEQWLTSDQMAPTSIVS